ncbi:MAG TPA: ThuA domain-containing protein [Candidatus Paceibacterota bacterium]|nr:ThuA domain-containing protein [Verrucomicrobiota bacterium]HOX02328.1 ThuA domain-containing protein [Verrucomicrobiota bacterium]HRZ45120.1 ThuA domain-containing protein [Candidatus Paceibacterota bacterium]HRZ93234.1 ThuA domain-containing protein [Candidatus Paceibacterota bacterium]
MKPLFILTLAAGIAAALPTSTLAADAPAKIKVLLISGDDVMPSHDWRQIADATRDVLDKSGRFDVKVCEDMFILESSTALARYDLIFLTRYNRVGTLTDAAKKNLLEFVSSGKGFAVSHLASASFPEWNEFRDLCGRYWVMRTSGHGPRGTFKAKIVDPDHPITRGIADFETDDELYAKLQGDAPIRVLAQADSDWSKKTEPLVWVKTFGQGRVFHETFGHDRAAIQHPSVARIIVRGCEWAATGKTQ